MSNLKTEAARRQLGTALALYLENKDPVAVHCLAGGGCELIEYEAQKMGGQPFASHALETFPELEISQLRRLQRQYWNAFKHATHFGGREREDDGLLIQFTDLQNDHALFIGWYDYAVAVDQMPIEAQVHQVWYLALYPEKLDPKYPVGQIEGTFPNLRREARNVQKQMLNDLIARARSDLRLMDDPKTDKRSLILGWP